MSENELPTAITADDLPELHPDHAEMVALVAQGYSVADAWVATHRDDTRKWGAQMMSAHRVMRRPDVQSWREALRTMGAWRLDTSLDTHVLELDRLAEMAANDGQYGPAITATKAKGQALGYYSRHEAPPQGQVIDAGIISVVEEILGPEAAATAAQRLGVKTETDGDTLPHPNTEEEREGGAEPENGGEDAG